MGLDVVELAMAVEAAFGIDIPDADAARLRTPREVVVYLAGRLPPAAELEPACVSQRAFDRARAACAARFGVERRALTPATPLPHVVPAADRRAHWAALREDLGVEAWPSFREPTWVGRHLGSGPGTLGELAGHLATWSPAALKDASEGWTRAELERAVVTLIEAETGVDMQRHTLDSSFVTDMGLD